MYSIYSSILLGNEAKLSENGLYLKMDFLLKFFFQIHIYGLWLPCCVVNSQGYQRKGRKTRNWLIIYSWLLSGDFMKSKNPMADCTYIVFSLR